MKISIIIPCYNCSSTVRETIESLESQVNQDFEVICINDGSTDDTLAVLEDLQGKTSLQMKVYTQKNSGVSKTRNYGISLAESEYILFLDADDIYNKNFTDLLLSAMENNDVDCVYCKLSRDLEKVKFEKRTNAVKLENRNEAMEKLLYEMRNYSFCCYLYKRNIIQKWRLKFNEDTKYFEDREFNWKYLCLCERFAWIDIELYGYRVNLNSATFKKMTWERCNTVLNAIKRIENYLQEHNCEYCYEVEKYLFARTMWGIMKGASSSKDRKLFRKIKETYDVKDCMRRLKKDRQRLVRIVAKLYLIHPSIFYFLVRLYSLLKRNVG